MKSNFIAVPQWNFPNRQHIFYCTLNRWEVLKKIFKKHNSFPLNSYLKRLKLKKKFTTVKHNSLQKQKTLRRLVAKKQHSKASTIFNEMEFYRASEISIRNFQVVHNRQTIKILTFLFDPYVTHFI